MIVALAACNSNVADHTHEPAADPDQTYELVTHLYDLIRPGIDEVTVLPLAAVDASQWPGLTDATVLSEGLELIATAPLDIEEPRAIADAHRGTYLLVNTTDNQWSGTVVCLRNYEQVRCGETAGVWTVALDPGQAAQMEISFSPVASGMADRIRLLPIAAPGSEQVQRIGGVYATRPPDRFEEPKLVEPETGSWIPMICDKAIVDGQTVVIRLCEKRDSLVRVLVFRDREALTIGSKWRQTDIYQLNGVGQFRLSVKNQLQDAGQYPTVVVLWDGTTGPVPETWIAQ